VARKPSKALLASLLRETSREALLDRLQSLAKTLELEQLLQFVAALILRAGVERQALLQRIAELQAARSRSSSERSNPTQLLLFAKTLTRLQRPQPPTPCPEAKPDLANFLKTTNEEIEALTEERRAARKAEQERKRQAQAEAKAAGEATATWPTHLPLREVWLDVDVASRRCGDCQQERTVLRVETSWHLERTVTTEVVVTHRNVRVCRSRHGGPVAPPPPPKPVDKGHLGFGLAAWALFLRFSHNLPLHRLVELFTAEGLAVTQDHLHTLVQTTVKRLLPVSEAIADQVRKAKLVNLDDTPVRVLAQVPRRPARLAKSTAEACPEQQPPADAPPHETDVPTQGSRQARVWIALGDGVWPWFFATPNWKAKGAERRLGTLLGTLQGDGYAAFKKMARTQGRKLAGCMAHLRRKLRAAMLAKDPRAEEPLALIQAMYRVECLARRRKDDAQALLALRKERSAPFMAALDAWAEKVAPTVERGSPLGKAWTYYKNQRPFLATFLTDGAVSIDNNAAERALRRITIGRKLWLFFRGDENLEGAAVLASVLCAARLHGAPELPYLTWLLQEVARRSWSAAHARELLPDRWLERQKQQLQEGAAVKVAAG
jgi:transposase